MQSHRASGELRLVPREVDGGVLARLLRDRLLPERADHVESSEVSGLTQCIQAILNVRQWVVLLLQHVIGCSVVQRKSPATLWLTDHDDGGSERRRGTRKQHAVGHHAVVILPRSCLSLRITKWTSTAIGRRFARLLERLCLLQVNRRTRSLACSRHGKVRAAQLLLLKEDSANRVALSSHVLLTSTIDMESRENVVHCHVRFGRKVRTDTIPTDRRVSRDHDVL